MFYLVQHSVVGFFSPPLKIFAPADTVNSFDLYEWTTNLQSVGWHCCILESRLSGVGLLLRGTSYGLDCCLLRRSARDVWGFTLICLVNADEPCCRWSKVGKMSTLKRQGRKRNVLSRLFSVCLSSSPKSRSPPPTTITTSSSSSSSSSLSSTSFSSFSCLIAIVVISNILRGVTLQNPACCILYPRPFSWIVSLYLWHYFCCLLRVVCSLIMVCYFVPHLQFSLTACLLVLSLLVMGVVPRQYDKIADFSTRHNTHKSERSGNIKSNWIRLSYLHCIVRKYGIVSKLFLWEW